MLANLALVVDSLTMNQTNQAILNHGLDNLEQVIEGQEPGDLHSRLFNEVPFIIGEFKATQFLEEYGVYRAIGEIKEWEESVHGEVNVDFSDPEKTVNMLAYIIGEDFLTRCPTLQASTGLLTKEDLLAIGSELKELLT